MSGLLHLTARYLAHHRVKAAILVASLTLILFLPAALRVLVAQSERWLEARAAATPLLVGDKGSELELVLGSLYFGRGAAGRIPFAEVARVADTGLATAIPLYVRFRAGPDPVVGTTVDYFAFRRLSFAAGGAMARLGDCVLGARVAAARGTGPGGHVLSSPENPFDLAGVYPLRMRVTGVLAPSGTADDDAVFADVRTAWVIEGIAHGHADIREGEVLERQGGNVAANASVVQYNEITDGNVGSFHFHGDEAGFPITAVLAVPPDHRSLTLLIGRYASPEEARQIVRPLDVIGELMDTVLTVEGFVVAALVLAGAATLATAALVFLLSLRLRAREIATMRRIGGSRGAIAWILASEAVVVLLVSLLLAAALAGIVSRLGPDVVRAWTG